MPDGARDLEEAHLLLESQEDSLPDPPPGVAGEVGLALPEERRNSPNEAEYAGLEDILGDGPGVARELTGLGKYQPQVRLDNDVSQVEILVVMVLDSIHCAVESGLI